MDSSGYLLGEPIALHVEVKHNPLISLLWEISDSIGGGFIKTKESTGDTFHISDGIIERKTLYLAGFDSGMREIPPLMIFYKDETGQLATVTTPAVRVMILPVHVDTSQAMKPIKTILPISATPENDTIWYVSLASSIIILGLALYFIFRKKRVRQTAATMMRAERYSYEVAAKKLSEIELLHLWQNDRTEEYYVMLSGVLRKYIQDTLQVPAMENTSSEIVALLSEKIQNPKLIEHLHRNLQVADLVKFARVHPFTDQHVEFMSTAKEFLDKTRMFSFHSQNGAPQ